MKHKHTLNILCLPVLPVKLFESQRRYWIHKEFDMHEESFEAHPLLLGEEDHVQYSLLYTMKGYNDGYEIRILIFLHNIKKYQVSTF